MKQEEKEIAYNASGYFDETPYKAIRNLKEDEERMNEDTAMGGDIWTLQKSNGAIQDVLILANHHKYVSILILMDKEPDYNPVKVHGLSMLWADAGRISWAFSDQLLNFQKSLTAAEYQKVMDKVVAALTAELPQKEEPEALPEVISEETQLPPAEDESVIARPEECILTLDAADSPFGKMEEEYRAMEIRLAQAEAERDVYKELFYKAFPQMSGVA